MTVSIDEHKRLLQEVDKRFMQQLPGYPFLPCPICHGVEGCDHTVTERLRASGVNWQSFASNQ